MNIFLNECFGFCVELNFELNHFSARFNEKINFQNVSPRAISHRFLHTLASSLLYFGCSLLPFCFCPQTQKLFPSLPPAKLFFSFLHVCFSSSLLWMFLRAKYFLKTYRAYWPLNPWHLMSSWLWKWLFWPHKQNIIVKPVFYIWEFCKWVNHRSTRFVIYSPPLSSIMSPVPSFPIGTVICWFWPKKLQ